MVEIEKGLTRETARCRLIENGMDKKKVMVMNDDQLSAYHNVLKNLLWSKNEVVEWNV